MLWAKLFSLMQFKYFILIFLLVIFSKTILTLEGNFEIEVAFKKH